MNNSQRYDIEEYRALQILQELADNNYITQRELSKRLGIALGLVNSYLKNLIKKGFVTVRNIPPRRYTYYLTPKGFAEKSRLALRLLQDYTRVYRQARSVLKQLFSELEDEGITKVVFAGSDEVAEIAYLSIQETGLKLMGVMDDERAGKYFFSYKIYPLSELSKFQYDAIVVASFVKRRELKERLKTLGVPERIIRQVF